MWEKLHKRMENIWDNFRKEFQFNIFLMSKLFIASKFCFWIFHEQEKKRYIHWMIYAFQIICSAHYRMNWYTEEIHITSISPSFSFEATWQNSFSQCYIHVSYGRITIFLYFFCICVFIKDAHRHTEALNYEENPKSKGSWVGTHFWIYLQTCDSEQLSKNNTAGWDCKVLGKFFEHM